MNARVAEWQTRTTQNRVRKLMWVQLPPWAPKQNLTAFSKPEGGTREARGGLKLNRTLGFCAPRPLPSVAGKPKIFLPYFRFSAGGVGGADKKWKGNFWFCFAASDYEMS